MLESLNYSFRNPKKHNLSNLPHQTVEKLQKNHGVLRGPQLDKQRWRARLGILRVNWHSYVWLHTLSSFHTHNGVDTLPIGHPVQWTERWAEQTEREKTRNVRFPLKSFLFIWFVNQVSVTASVLFFESLYPRLIIQRIHPCSLPVYVGVVNTAHFRHSHFGVSCSKNNLVPPSTS